MLCSLLATPPPPGRWEVQGTRAGQHLLTPVSAHHQRLPPLQGPEVTSPNPRGILEGWGGGMGSKGPAGPTPQPFLRGRERWELSLPALLQSHPGDSVHWLVSAVLRTRPQRPDLRNRSSPGRHRGGGSRWCRCFVYLGLSVVTSPLLVSTLPSILS